jgi:hypothetical protein
VLPWHEKNWALHAPPNQPFHLLCGISAARASMELESSVKSSRMCGLAECGRILRIHASVLQLW